MHASSGPISVATAEHYTWGAGADGWHLVREAGLSVIQERMPPGSAEQRHRHAVARQFFFVLGGTLEIEVEGTTHTLGPREGLEVAPGLAHEVRNASTEPIEFLVVSQPPSHGDRTAAPSARRDDVDEGAGRPSR
jgi:mannose-6-phosphate isomerase-like protein (cupin superfamily)